MFILPRFSYYILLGALISTFNDFYEHSDVYRQLLINLVINDADSSAHENEAFLYVAMLFAVVCTVVLTRQAICGIQHAQREKLRVKELEKDNPFEVRLAKINYKESVPPEYVDPVSRQIMCNPVYLISTTGLALINNAYDLNTAKHLLEDDNPKCYLTMVPCNAYRVAPDLKQQIEQWLKEVEQQASAKLKLNAVSLWKKTKPTPQNSKQVLSIATHRLR